MNDPRDIEAQVSDGMSDVMAGSTIAFMSITVIMIVTLLTVLLTIRLKDEQESQSAGGSQRYVRAGYQVVENVDEGVIYLLDIEPSVARCEKPMDVRFVCRAPSHGELAVKCDKNGPLKNQGVVPR